MNSSIILIITFLLSSVQMNQSLAQTTSQETVSQIVFDENNCLDGQDLNSPDVDVSKCPPLPSYPQETELGNTSERVSLGAWELGTTSDGQYYKYGSLTLPNQESEPYKLNHDNGSSDVSIDNIQCWAKGYYRLRKILQNPPDEYVKLRNNGYQGRFFQFQTDLRLGDTGFTEISSYMDHLVKWVTVIDQDGICQQPTLEKFKTYLNQELEIRGL